MTAPRVVTPPPGPRSRALMERQERVLYPGLAHGTYPFVAARKAGWTVEDVDGNVYADLASGSGSVPLGAAPPAIVEAAVEAIRRFGNEDTHALTTELVAPLAERLLALAPASLTRLDIALNGTEAIETALRVMRRATGRPIVVGFHSAYHGESSLTAALGAEHHEIAAGARALVGGFEHIPYPHPYRSPFGPPRPGGSGDATVDYLRDHVLFHAVDPREVAGVVIEPIVGSGGVLEPPATFWPALTALCEEFGWLLCLDEVKTGFGRTGTLFAAERWDLQPDLMCLGKAMGGGVMPIGALLGSERALGGFDGPLDRQHVVVAAGLLRRRAGDARRVRRRRRAGERAGAGRRRARGARRAAGALRPRRRRARGRRLHRARARRRPGHPRARAGAAGGARLRVPGPRRPVRLEHDVPERPAVAGDGARRPPARPRAGRRRRRGGHGGALTSGG